ncbi:hypothetical protein J2Y69_000675 [Microbacterium resistens]|uniref:Uncharacterized protein n=1 Tax=Microbacterium resistens TaxID=156977 RepID=A0ABU1S8Z7_9MICO|nr:hypothetical protein [Microbacterium resistens]MDR6866090.1 hypothetical protein [Microbacterium resistens]
MEFLTTSQDVEEIDEVFVVRPPQAAIASRKPGAYELHLYRQGAQRPDSVAALTVHDAQGSLDVARAVEGALRTSGLRLAEPLAFVRGVYYRAAVTTVP